MTTVVYLENALCPERRRVELYTGLSLNQLNPMWDLPYIVFVDGKPILRADWELVPQDNQCVAFIDVRAIPQGGGGGGGSDPTRMVLMMAMMWATAGMGASLSFAMGGGEFLGSVAGLSALQTGVNLVGMALVNAVIPAPSTATSTQAAAAMATPSPTYTLQAQGNSARLDSAIPEHFGRMIAFPDFAAQPYTEYSGNEQYLYMLLCVGRGYYDFESVRIEDTVIFTGNSFTPTANFEDITIQKVEPSQSPTLFPANVIASVEVSGQSPLCWAGTYSQTGTVLTATVVAHGKAPGATIYLQVASGGATSGSYTVATVPTTDTFTIAAPSYTGSGNVTVSDWIGGFIANPGNTAANFLGFDWVMPRGIYSLNTTTGVLSNMSITVLGDYRQVDNSGTPVAGAAGVWANLFTETFTAGTTTPQRYTKRYPVNSGRYEVRVRRNDAEQTGSSFGHNVVWGGLRSYLPEVALFGDTTLLAVRMKASNNLSSLASRKLNVVATRKLPIWNGSSWSALTATRSPSWALVYACKQVGMTDIQIDLAGLLTLDATCTSRGDSFDARFDNFVSFWETATKMMGCVRAKPYMQGGLLRVVRDQAATIPVAMFSVRNIVQGSFSINYLMPTAETADAIDVKYFDSIRWIQTTVRAKLVGSSALTPAKIELFGVTGRDQAYREGMYQSAANRYRRRIITFKTEMEGFIPSFGDLIAIQHDMPAWGQGGELTDTSRVGINLLMYSEQFDNGAGWSRTGVTVAANADTAPDGTFTADKICLDASTAFHFVSPVPSIPLGPLVATCFFKSAEFTTASMFMTQGGNNGAIFDLTAVTATPSGTGNTASIVSVGGGWFKCTLKQSNSGVSGFRIGPGNGCLASSTGTVGNGINAWGAQLEPGTVANLYIPTTSAQIKTLKTRYNLLTYSEQFDNAAWTTTNALTVTANAAISPLGTVTADKLVYTGAIDTYRGQNTDIGTTVGGKTFTFSVWAWTDAGQPTDSQIFLYDGTVAYVYQTFITLTTVATRYTITAAIDPAATSHILVARFDGPNNPSAGQYCYVWGAQLEPGSTASPYTPTGATAITTPVAAVTLSETPVWGSGPHYLGLRKRDGSVDGPFLVTQGGTPNELLLVGEPSFTPYIGGAEERTHYSFGWSETWRQRARVLSVKPDNLTTSTVTCVNEDDNVHTADSSLPTPTQVTSQLAGYTNIPSVLGLIARSMPADPTAMLLTWTPSPWADHYLIEQSNDAIAWTRTGESSTSNYTASALYGPATIVRVAAVGIAKGPWAQVQYGGSADYMWSATDTNLMWNAVTSTLMWKY